MQTPLAIGVPFTPSIGCRIDFKNIPINALTPSTMLDRQLVFSPLKKPNEVATTITPKRTNLSIISEEAVDISRELDCYQLELENSMNEAKATKKRGNKNLMDIKRKNSFAIRISVGIDDVELNSRECGMNDEINQIKEITELPKTCEHSCHDSTDEHNECPKSSTPKTPNENCIAKYPLDKSINENPDVVYEEVDETQSDQKIYNEIKHDEEVELFKNPAPFVRVYRRDIGKKSKQPVASNEQNDTEAVKNTKIDDKQKDTNEVFNGIRSSIRKSIRKLIHPNSNTKNKNVDEVIETKEPSGNILTSIRHSLRRKHPKQQPLATSTPCESLNDISIIIDIAKPRTVFKDADIVAKISKANDDGLFRTRSNLRSSFRRSSQNVMKTVFKKKIENYNLDK